MRKGHGWRGMAAEETPRDGRHAHQRSRHKERQPDPDRADRQVRHQRSSSRLATGASTAIRLLSEDGAHGAALVLASAALEMMLLHRGLGQHQPAG